MSLNNLLIVGLGNPTKNYEKTRHNVGADFLRLLSKHLDIPLVNKEKLLSNFGSKQFPEIKIYLSIPNVYMNESGRTIAKIKNYLKLPSQNILVVHDEIDLPTGKLKLKESGGHGGHNGVRDVIDHLQGDSSFKRLRIGIGHPKKNDDVINYVLSSGNKNERNILKAAMQSALPIIDRIIKGEWQQAMLELHTKDT